MEGVRKESGDEAARKFEVDLRATDVAFERDGAKLAQTVENIAERGDPLAKLGRYEERLEGTLYRALQELRRVQHRRGQTVTVDAVEVSSSDETGG